MQNHIVRDSLTTLQIDRLRAQLADVAQGKAFLLQGGDCAELFSACSQVRFIPYTYIIVP